MNEEKAMTISKQAKRWIDLLKLAAAAALLFSSSCSDFITPTRATPAQRDKINQGLALISIPSIGGFLTDLTVNGPRHPTYKTEMDAYQALLEGYFTSYGVYSFSSQPVTVANPRFAPGPISMNNLIWTKVGTDPSLAPVLVTAHWDSVPWGPGANDNGSGCACLIEIARVISALHLSFRRTVVFVMFALEEEGMPGSAYYAAHMTQYPALVLNLDMLGYTSAHETLVPLSDVLLNFPSTGDFIGVLASRPAARAGLTWIRAADDFVPELKYYFAICDSNVSNDPLMSEVMRGDHASFWPYGVPAIMCSDTAEFREGSPYHTAADTPAHIDFDFLLANVKATFADLCIEAEVMP
jgi:aminopeptidase YwaD